MSTGTGKGLPPGIILLLGSGDNQVARSNLGSGTAGEGAGHCSSGGSPEESLSTHPSLVGRTLLPSGGVREQQLHNRA